MPSELDDYSLTGLPVWVRAIAILGFPSFVACLLLGAILGWIKSPLSETLALQEKLIMNLQQHELETLAARQDLIDGTNYQNALLRVLCRNLVAKQDLSACEPSWRGYSERSR